MFICSKIEKESENDYLEDNNEEDKEEHQDNTTNNDLNIGIRQVDNYGDTLFLHQETKCGHVLTLTQGPGLVTVHHLTPVT